MDKKEREIMRWFLTKYRHHFIERDQMNETLQMIQGKAIAAAFNDLNPIGTPVIKIDDMGNHIETKTRSEAWVLGHGQAVVSVEGPHGGAMNLERIISGSRNVELKNNALTMIRRYGGIDGAHHKDWVLDQVVRSLTNCPLIEGDYDADGGPVLGESEEYLQWVKDAKDGEDGPDTYSYEIGIAP